MVNLGREGRGPSYEATPRRAGAPQSPMARNTSSSNARDVLLYI